MAVKDLIGPGFVGSETIQYIVTRGMSSIDPQMNVAIIFQSNVLIGDALEEEHFLKGVAVTGFTFLLLDAGNGTAITSGTVTGKITKDGGTQGAVAGSFVHEGNGQWSVNLSATEMDADVIGLTFLHSSAVPVYKTLRTK
jgi:hypothetical protein